MIDLSLNDFNRLRELIYSNCGIQINDGKRTMVEGRLQRRIKGLGMQSFSQYCDYLFSQRGMEDELVYMINEITTNKTDFFREPEHFEYLSKKAVPGLLQKGGARRAVSIWSAGCSSGEEPYTLAMVLNELGCKFIILATDISTKVLEKAKRAVYSEETIAPIPTHMKKKYLMKSKDSTNRIYRIIPELRQCIHYRRLNFMDGDFGFREPIDIIFCRNVVIYFDKPTQERLINKFCECLSPDGFIFMGHSETLFGMDVPLTQVLPTIYRKSP